MMPSRRRDAISGCRSYLRAALLAAIVMLALITLMPYGLCDKAIHIAYIYSPLCSTCERSTPVIRSVINDYRGLDIRYSEHSFSSKEGMDYMERYGLSSVPAIIVEGRAIRFEDFNGDTRKLEALLRQSISDASKTPSNAAVRVATRIPNVDGELSVAAVFLAGLLAGINPCLLAVMMFVSAMAMSIKGRRTDIIFNLLAFCAGLLFIYLAMGVGFLRLIEKVPSIAAAMRTGIILITFGLAGFAFYEAYQVKANAERPSIFKSFVGRYKPLYRKFSLAASFGLGIAFGLVKMPCVGGIYVAILGAILESGETGGGLPYLAAYNLGVVLPVLALGVFLALGLSPARVEEFRERHRMALKAMTGLLLAAMAVGLMLNAL